MESDILEHLYHRYYSAAFLYCLALPESGIVCDIGLADCWIHISR